MQSWLSNICKKKHEKMWLDDSKTHFFFQGSRFNNYRSAHDISWIKNVVPKHALKQKRFHGYFTAKKLCWYGRLGHHDYLLWWEWKDYKAKRVILDVKTENISNFWPSWMGGSPCILKKDGSFFLFLYCYTVLQSRIFKKHCFCLLLLFWDFSLVLLSVCIFVKLSFLCVYVLHVCVCVSACSCFTLLALITPALS